MSDQESRSPTPVLEDGRPVLPDILTLEEKEQVSSHLLPLTSDVPHTRAHYEACLVRVSHLRRKPELPLRVPAFGQTHNLRWLATVRARQLRLA